MPERALPQEPPGCSQSFASRGGFKCLQCGGFSGGAWKGCSRLRCLAYQSIEERSQAHRPEYAAITANKGSENNDQRSTCKLLVRKGGLEPPRVSPPDPKSGASANSATFARIAFRGSPKLYRELSLPGSRPAPQGGRLPAKPHPCPRLVSHTRHLPPPPTESTGDEPRLAGRRFREKGNLPFRSQLALACQGTGDRLPILRS